MNEKIYEEAKLIFINENISITKIADRLNIDRKKLSKKLKENGLYNGKGYTEKQVSDVLKRYSNGETLQSICKDMNISRYSMVNHLKTNGYLESKEDNSYETYKNMIEEYLSEDFTTKELLKKYNLSEPKFLRILKMNNISKSNRKYKFDEKYFDNINTEEKAYWLGFLYADGYVGEHTVELTLKESDKSHLEKFANCLGYTGPISYKSEVKAFRVSICSKYLCNSLTNKGCMKNKSLILKFPTNDQVPDKLIKHFIRGYIDGDGSIGLYFSNKTDKIKQFSLSVVGTKDFLDKVYEILIKNCDISKTKYYPNGNALAFKIAGNKQNTRIMKYLYEDAKLYLDRKYEIYSEFKLLIAQLSQQYTGVITL